MKKMKLNFKKLISFLVVVSIFIGTTVSAFSDTRLGSNSGEIKGYVTVSMEKFTLGLGYIIEPVKVPIYEDIKVSEIITEALGKGNYSNTGTVDDSFYLSSVKDNDNREAKVPKYILDECGSISDRGKAGWLGEFDYTPMAGWMYCVNNQFPNYGAAAYYPKDGDVIRWQFTTYGYGMDIGGGFSGDATSGSFGGSYVPIANKDELTEKLAEVNSSPDKDKLLSKKEVKSAYDSAKATVEIVDSKQADVDKVTEDLTKALGEGEKLAVELKNPSKDVKTAINETGAYMHKTISNPTVASVGGEWTVLSLARSGYNVPKEYYDNYYNEVVRVLKECNGELHSVKYTEYSRVILALTSIGKDVTNVGGYNLLKPLSDFNGVKKQGINGPIFALIALDTHSYEIPKADEGKVQTTREGLIDYILNSEVTTKDGVKGGWALSGTVPDPDMTAMALQSLALYKDDAKVKPYIDRAVEALSKLQKPNGGYESWGSLNSESIAQVIVALTSLGINPAKDTRFIKEDGSWVVSAIMDFYVAGGGFKHVLNSDVNAMATDQAMYALAAYDRFSEGKNSLYNMNDVKIEKSSEGKVLITAPDRVAGNKGTEFDIKVKVGSWPKGNYKLLDGIINIPNFIDVEGIEASKTLEGGLPDFKLSDNKLRIVYKNTELKNINVKSDTFPADVITIKAKVNKDLKKDEKLELSVGNLSLKGSSDISTTFNYDVSEAKSTVTIGDPIEVKGRILYEGDGVDLIPGDKVAIAAEFSNVNKGSKAVFNENTDMLYSPELSAKSGKETFIALVDRGVALEGLNNIAKYNISNKAGAEILFGDTNSDKQVNAQDTLNVLTGWLRKSATPENDTILRMNVTGDSRIDTYDVIGIMENYINGSEFRVLSN